MCESDQITLLELLLNHDLSLENFNDEVFKAAKRKHLNAHIYAYVEQDDSFTSLPEEVKSKIKNFSTLTVRLVSFSFSF